MERARAAVEASPTPTTRQAAKARAASPNRTILDVTGALTFSFDGAGGACTTTTEENFSKDAEFVLEITAYEFDPADGSFDLTFFDEDNDGSVESVIMNAPGGRHWNLAKGSGVVDGRTDLKGVTFDAELGSTFNTDPPVRIKGSITCP